MHLTSVSAFISVSLGVGHPMRTRQALPAQTPADVLPRQVNHKKTDSETPGKHIIARITMLTLPAAPLSVLADIRSTVSRSKIIAATLSSSFVVTTGNRANAHMRATSVSPV
jgi:hypothetical protein